MVLSTHGEQQRSREEWKTGVDAGNNPDYLFFFLDCILLNLELFWAVTSEASVYSPEMLP